MSWKTIAETRRCEARKAFDILFPHFDELVTTFQHYFGSCWIVTLKTSEENEVKLQFHYKGPKEWALCTIGMEQTITSNQSLF